MGEARRSHSVDAALDLPRSEADLRRFEHHFPFPI
jgi:hypothetical protein